MSKTIGSMQDLSDYLVDLHQRVDPNSVASNINNVYKGKPGTTPDVQKKLSVAVNTSIMELSSTFLDSSLQPHVIYTAYYLIPVTSSLGNVTFKLHRRTSKSKCLASQRIEEEAKMLNNVSKKITSEMSTDAPIFMYDRIFKEMFEKILNYYKTSTKVSLLSRALMRKAKFQRVNSGTLSVGYSKVHKAYLIRYNPEFVVNATIRYFLSPVPRANGTYRAPNPGKDKMLSPFLFFLEHEMGHVFYRHVTSKDDDLNKDLPHYVTQYFGDSYINNMIPYMPGSEESDAVKSGDQNYDITTPNARHIGYFGDEFPVENYLKKHYIKSVYESIISDDTTSLDKAVHDALSRYMNIEKGIGTKNSIKNDLGYSDVDQFLNILDSYPDDIKKRVYRTHVKFFVGNLFDIMSRVFTKGFSSSSYMRILKQLMDNLFEDLKLTEAAPPKKKPQPQQQQPQGDPQDQQDGESGDDSDDSGQSGGEGEQDSPPQSGGDRQGGASDQQDPSGESGESGEGEGDGGGSPPPMPGLPPESEDQDDMYDPDEQPPGGGGYEGDQSDDGDDSGDSQADDSQGDPGESGESGDSGESDHSSDEGTQDRTNHQFKVGDLVVQKSTGKIGKIIGIDADGNYKVDTSINEGLSVFEAIQLKALNESVIVVSGDDLEFYNNQQDGGSDSSDQQSGDQSGDSNDESSDDTGGNPADQDFQDPDSGDPGDSTSGPDQDQGGPSGSDQSQDTTTPSHNQRPFTQDDLDNSGKDNPPDDGGGEGPESDDPDTGPDNQKQSTQQTPQSKEDSEPGHIPPGDPTERSWDDGFDKVREEMDQAHEDSKNEKSDQETEYAEEDEITRQEADRELDDEDTKSDVQDTIKKEVQDAKEKGEKIDDMINGLDKEEIAKTYQIDMDQVKPQVSQSKWKMLFRQLLSQASGTDLQRDNARPSRKVEGLWGANKKVPSIKDVVILLDCSGSMGATQFKALFSELQVIGKLPELKDVWVHLIPWGDEATYKRFKSLTPPIVKQMYTYGKVDLGGTFIGCGYEMMMKKVRNPDLVIVMTDAELVEEWRFRRSSDVKPWIMLPDGGSYGNGNKPTAEEEKVNTYIKRVNRKTVFVSISPGRSKPLEYVDASYKRRLVEVDPSQAKKGDF